jgi:hypothetical protein
MSGPNSAITAPYYPVTFPTITREPLRPLMARPFQHTDVANAQKYGLAHSGLIPQITENVAQGLDPFQPFQRTSRQRIRYFRPPIIRPQEDLLPLTRMPHGPVGIQTAADPDIKPIPAWRLDHPIMHPRPIPLHTVQVNPHNEDVFVALHRLGLPTIPLLVAAAAPWHSLQPTANFTDNMETISRLEPNDLHTRPSFMQSLQAHPHGNAAFEMVERLQPQHSQTRASVLYSLPIVNPGQVPANAYPRSPHLEKPTKKLIGPIRILPWDNSVDGQTAAQLALDNDSAFYRDMVRPRPELTAPYRDSDVLFHEMREQTGGHLSLPLWMHKRPTLPRIQITA